MAPEDCLGVACPQPPHFGSPPALQGSPTHTFPCVEGFTGARRTDVGAAQYVEEVPPARVKSETSTYVLRH